MPVYLGFLGLAPDSTVALIACFYTVIVGFLMVSRLPVYSGKSSGSRVRREYVLPLILGLVLYVLFLTSYTWLTLSLSTIAYLGFLVFSMRAYSRRAAREENLAPQDTTPEE